MGVTGLWPILAPVKQHRTLKSLEGQTLAVDLSIWVVENQGVQSMQGRVQKPHLRNLFFRISTLLQMGTKLVFVIEGEAPELKHEEMHKRLQVRNGKKASAPTTKRKFNRSHFKSLLRECCEMMDALGVPYIQGKGEAERMCAALNSAGIVDACISDDGDCFLYGATVVYRNITLDSKDPHVESYSMADITSDLGLTRERLVALALLLGCDYFPAGVPGVGEVGALKLMSSLGGLNVLDRFHDWKKMSSGSECVDSVELSVWRKATGMPDFPPDKVIEEFLVPKERVLSTPPAWQRPRMVNLMTLGTKYLEWPEQYSLEKVLPLTTLWDQLDILRSSTPLSTTHLKPCRIVKKRVRQGVACVEVEWENSMKGLVDESGEPRVLVTIEREDRFQACFPALLNDYAEEAKAAKPKRTRKPKGKKDADVLAEQMETLTLNPEGHNLDSYDLGMEASGGYPLSSVASTAKSSKMFSQSNVVDETCDQFSSLSDQMDKVSIGNSDICRYPPRSSGLQDFAPSSPTEKGTTRHSINRKTEYVPLSQRLLALSPKTEGQIKKEDSDDDVIDLDQSYTYIPLSQRIKARLGNSNVAASTSSVSSLSSNKSTLSSSSAYSEANKGQGGTKVTESQGRSELKSQGQCYSPSPRDQYSYVPLGQRLRTSLGSSGGNFTSSIVSSTPLIQDSRNNSSATTSTSSQRFGACIPSASEMNVDSHCDVTAVVESSQEKKSSKHSEPVAETLPNTQTHPVCSRKADSQKADGPECSQKSDAQKADGSEHSQKAKDGCSQKPDKVSSKPRAFSQKSKSKSKIIVSDLNWSDESENENEEESEKMERSYEGKCEQEKIKIGHEIKLEHDEKEEAGGVHEGETETIVISDDSDIDCANAAPNKNSQKCVDQGRNDVVKRDNHDKDSESNILHKPSVNTSEVDLFVHDSVLETSAENSVAEAMSFVSDGHFTLVHSLFTSLAESDASLAYSDTSRDVSALSVQSPMPSSHTRSLEFESPTSENLQVQPSVSNLPSPCLDIQSRSPSLEAQSPKPTSDLSHNCTRNKDAVAKHDFRNTQQFGSSNNTHSQQCIDNNQQNSDKTEVQQSKSNSLRTGDNSSLDESFLPLSQRLRLKSQKLNSLAK